MAEAARRRSAGIEGTCQELLRQQADAHERAMAQKEESHKNVVAFFDKALTLANESADRASKRRDDTVRYFLYLFVVLISGLAAVDITGFRLPWVP